MAERSIPGTAADIEYDMRLQAGQVGFGAVLFQSLTHIAHRQQYPSLRFARMGAVADAFRARTGAVTS